MDEEELPVFYGNGDDPEVWVSWLDSYGSREGFSDFHYLQYAYGLVEEDAHAWWIEEVSHSPFRSWDECKLRLIQRFGKPQRFRACESDVGDTKPAVVEIATMEQTLGEMKKHLIELMEQRQLVEGIGQVSSGNTSAEVIPMPVEEEKQSKVGKRIDAHQVFDKRIWRKRRKKIRWKMKNTKKGDKSKAKGDQLIETEIAGLREDNEHYGFIKKRTENEDDYEKIKLITETERLWHRIREEKAAVESDEQMVKKEASEISKTEPNLSKEKTSDGEEVCDTFVEPKQNDLAVENDVCQVFDEMSIRRNERSTLRKEKVKKKKKEKKRWKQDPDYGVSAIGDDKKDSLVAHDELVKANVINVDDTNDFVMGEKTNIDDTNDFVMGKKTNIDDIESNGAFIESELQAGVEKELDKKSGEWMSKLKKIQLKDKDQECKELHQLGTKIFHTCKGQGKRMEGLRDGVYEENNKKPSEKSDQMFKKLQVEQIRMTETDAFLERKTKRMEVKCDGDVGTVKRVRDHEREEHYYSLEKASIANNKDGRGQLWFISANDRTKYAFEVEGERKGYMNVTYFVMHHMGEWELIILLVIFRDQKAWWLTHGENVGSGDDGYVAWLVDTWNTVSIDFQDYAHIRATGKQSEVVQGPVDLVALFSEIVQGLLGFTVWHCWKEKYKSVLVVYNWVVVFSGLDRASKLLQEILMFQISYSDGIRKEERLQMKLKALDFVYPAFATNALEFFMIPLEHSFNQEEGSTKAVCDSRKACLIVFDKEGEDAMVTQATGNASKIKEKRCCDTDAHTSSAKTAKLSEIVTANYDKWLTQVLNEPVESLCEAGGKELSPFIGKLLRRETGAAVKDFLEVVTGFELVHLTIAAMVQNLKENSQSLAENLHIHGTWGVSQLNQEDILELMIVSYDWDHQLPLLDSQCKKASVFEAGDDKAYHDPEITIIKPFYFSVWRHWRIKLEDKLV